MSIIKFELEPTEENIFDSIKQNTLARNKYVWRFCKLLNEIDDSCVLALNAKWGEGKTFFIKQVKMVLDAYDNRLHLSENDVEIIKNEIEKYKRQDHYEKELNPQLCFYYDAWEHDDDDEPVLSLLHSITKITDDSINVGDIAEQLATIANQILPINVKEIVDGVKSADLLSNEKQKENVRKSIDEYLETINIEKGERTVIIIDELDRCKPTYAIKLLERIKHFFNYKNITFIFSVNLTELQHTVKEYYGAEFDGYSYLNRFFDHVLDIPEADIDYYLETIRFEYNANYFEIYAKEVIRQYSFSVRQTEKYIRTIRNAIGEWVKNNSNVSINHKYYTSVIGSFMIPLMIGLKIKDINQYNSFIEGNNSQAVVDLVNNMTDICLYKNSLISINETFDDTVDEDKELVKEEDVMKKMYEYIFDDYVKSTNPNRSLGNIIIPNNAKEELINSCSMLSDYTLFDKRDETL